MTAWDPIAPNWGKIPPVKLLGTPSVAGTQLRLTTSAGSLCLTLHDCGLRLRSEQRARSYGMLVDEPVELPLAMEATADGLRVSAVATNGARLAVLLSAEPLSFQLFCDDRLVQKSPTDGHFVRKFRLPPFAKLPAGWLVSFDLEADTKVYGLGEKSGRLDKRGQLLRSHNHDALGLNAEWSYKNSPFAWSPDGWGVFIHTSAAVSHGVGYGPWSQRSYVAVVSSDCLDVFILSGRDGAAQLAQYTALTGRAPAPPPWSLGVILSKAYYRDADEILSVAREVRRRDMPCEIITFDGRAWQDTDTRFAFEWCPRRYPDPRPTVQALREMGFRICVWEYPLISVRNPKFAELAGKGWLLKDRRSGEAYRFRFDPEPFGQVLTQLPESGLLDFTHPDAYAWWRDQHKALFDLGIDMIKADFGEQIEPDMLAHNGADGAELHNVYGLLYNRCVYEAASKFGANGAFLFSRASWTGSQRYPSQWGGDPQADWGGMAGNLRSGLSWGLTGAPYYATDVGGFYGDQRDPVLYVRWLQMAIFSAHLRLHGIGAREPWSYGPQAEALAMTALRLRNRLLPYLESAVAAAANTGLPVQRPMVLAFPDDPAAWAFEDQFMFGDDLLVAPCLRADGQVNVYLPQADWCRFPDRESISGGCTHHLRLKLSEMAVFVRRGTRVSLGPETGLLRGRISRNEDWVA